MRDLDILADFQRERQAEMRREARLLNDALRAQIPTDPPAPSPKRKLVVALAASAATVFAIVRILGSIVGG